MEVAGLALSAIALASLFSTCVECFTCYEAARDAEIGLNTILVQLDLEKTRLLIWGDQVGILKTTEQGRSRYLDQFNDQLQEVFKELKRLLTEGDGNRDKYGRMLRSQHDNTIGMIRDDLSRNSTRFFASSWEEFRRIFRPNANTALRVRWAISGKRQFEELILEVRGLVDSLNLFIEVPRQILDNIVFREITMVDDLARLHLVEEASRGVYEPWAERARTVISQSEAGTLDHREPQEVYHDQHPPTVPRSTTPSSYSSRVSLPNNAKLLFVLTERCSRLATDTPCNPITFGRDALTESPDFTHEAEWGRSWSIGNTGFEEIRPDDPEQWQKWEMDASSLRRGGTVLIYCSPCVCQVHTAFGLISSSRFGSPIIDIRIRVDDRIRSSCCEQGSGSANVRNLRSGLDTGAGIKGYFDRRWLDIRIDDLDEEGGELPLSEQAAGDHTNPGNVWPPLVQVIVLGECDPMTTVMNSPPFRREPRMPRANRIYLMGPNGGSDRRFLGSFDPSNNQV